MEHRNRSLPQFATNVTATTLDTTVDTPNEDDHDILREIAQQMKRTSGDIEKKMQHSEGAALNAAILAGREALSKGKSKPEVAAVILSAGENVCGRETWMCSDSILLAEALVIGTRTERHGTPQEAADLQDMRRGDGAATAASSSQRRSSPDDVTGETISAAKLKKKNAGARSLSQAAKASLWW